MTDKQWETKIKKCVVAYHRYESLLRQCEEEYERRYKVNPSEVDDDNWIDLLHQGIGFVDINEIIDNIKLHVD